MSKVGFTMIGVLSMLKAYIRGKGIIWGIRNGGISGMFVLVNYKVAQWMVEGIGPELMEVPGVVRIGLAIGIYGGIGLKIDRSRRLSRIRDRIRGEVGIVIIGYIMFILGGTYFILEEKVRGGDLKMGMLGWVHVIHIGGILVIGLVGTIRRIEESGYTGKGVAKAILEVGLLGMVMRVLMGIDMGEGIGKLSDEDLERSITKISGGG